MFSKLLIATTLAGSVASSLFTSDSSVQKSLFEDFKVEYGKKYSTMEEETRRFYIFVDNLKVADERNAEEKKNGGSAIHGITQFADLSQVEFETTYLLADPSMKSADRNYEASRPEPLADIGLVDWSGKLTTDVKNQGYCGSCWAFSATEQIESDGIRAKKWKQTDALSPEQITQCDHTSSGCSGGWTERAYEYVKTAGGITTAEEYPYTSFEGTTGICHADPKTFKIDITGFTTVRGEANMASYVQSTGPLSVCLDAARWNTYKGGVVTRCGNRVDHCVQAVGVFVAPDGYWKIRNSWGVTWGELGYIRLAYGEDMCKVTEDPTYVTIA